ncbi:helix-turn-helix domain-containing protein [Cellulosimicrobium cellulans]|uniref:helix-turn-helix domain-containing protein n=1 Tax=Cellulosimicrobium cellulans TaxID=1710 RepID=UPI0024067790|nr:helix-turn-helix transcriptional regulator [Cellulosimicrobium cellulans]MDF9874810.1 transcriptional regulator with XRE-family HTH domain [Cellulosimicrobium cellulans]
MTRPTSAGPAASAATSVAAVVAGEVRAHMARRRLAQSDLVAAAGKTQAYWSRRLTGAVPLDVVDLAALAAVLGVSVLELLAPLDDRDRRRAGSDRPSSALAVGHVDATAAPARRGTSFYVHPRCSCGWLDWTAYRTDEPASRDGLVDVARERWQAHARDAEREA